MKKQLVFVISGLILTGCATKPKDGQPVDVAEYRESVIALSSRDQRRLAELHCPEDTKWKEEDWKTLVKRANHCVSKGKWEKVEAIGDHIAQVDHLGPWGSYYLSLASEAKKQWARAEWMIDLAIKKAPSMGLLYYQKARLQWAQGANKAAVASVSKALKLDPRIVDAHLFMGLVLYRDHAFSDAEDSFNAALKIEPKNTTALIGLAETELKQGDSGAAAHWLAELTRLEPRNAVYRQRLAHVYEIELQDYEKALESYKLLKALLRNDQKAAQNLDFNLDEKITAIELRVTQEKKVTYRKPAEEKRVVE